jgi:hypothetical protein
VTHAVEVRQLTAFLHNLINEVVYRSFVVPGDMAQNPKCSAPFGVDGVLDMAHTFLTPLHPRNSTRSKRTCPPKHLLFLAALATTSALSANTVLYLENFSNLREFNRPATDTGWQAFCDEGTPNPDHHLAELADPHGQQFNSPLGNPEGVNNNPVLGAEFGAVFWSPTFRHNVTIATQEFAGVLQSSELVGFTWDYSVDSPSGGEGAEFHKRALVQVGGSASDTDNWYVSDPMISYQFSYGHALERGTSQRLL